MLEFEPLKRIGDGVYYFRHDGALKVPNKGYPSLIVLCTWLGGATPRRIKKYITGYRALYPESDLLLITTRILDIAALPFSVLHTRLAPARSVIRQYIDHDTTVIQPSLLLHLFSHGGCNTALQLAVSLQNEHIQFGSQLHADVIFDCCPGDSNIDRGYKAATLSLPPSPVAQLIGKMILYPFMWLLTTLQRVGIMRSVDDMRVHLNDPNAFGESARRLYLYSLTDEAVRWEDVERHMDEARVKDYCVEGVVFEDSPHCTLLRQDPLQYWSAIEQFWKASASAPR
ncbi:hypothetical protein FQN49_000803 [Arthroderma sp. PD_2]|nr:hypothetical protein FQN49_000803 [Arthroderma sp. PD_2]